TRRNLHYGKPRVDVVGPYSEDLGEFLGGEPLFSKGRLDLPHPELVQFSAPTVDESDQDPADFEVQRYVWHRLPYDELLCHVGGAQCRVASERELSRGSEYPHLEE